jgi:hypothetical protein
MREEIERPGDCLDDLKGGRHLASLNRTYRVPVKVSHLRQVLLTPTTLKTSAANLLSEAMAYDGTGAHSAEGSPQGG